MLYKAATRYKSQRLREKAAGFINADMLFWPRYTTNLALKAEIKVTSGDKKYLNDFKLLDTNNVCRNGGPLGWKPDSSDAEKAIMLLFEKPILISMGKIYVIETNDQNTVRIVVDGNEWTEMSFEGPGIITFNLPRPAVCREVHFKFRKAINIGELELFEARPTPPSFPPFSGANQRARKKKHQIHCVLASAYNFLLGQIERAINICKGGSYKGERVKQIDISKMLESPIASLKEIVLVGRITPAHLEEVIGRLFCEKAPSTAILPA